MGPGAPAGQSTSYDASTKKHNKVESTDPTHVRIGSEAPGKDMSQPSAVDGESHLQLTSATQAEQALVDSQYGGPEYRQSQAASFHQTNPSAIQQYYQQLNQGAIDKKKSSQRESLAASMSTASQGHMPPMKKVQKTNVLTGAASTSYQLPVIWAGQYMGLVGYQVQKENEENEKRLQQLQSLAKQATLKKAEKKKAHVSLPMRGRRVFMMDKVSDQYIKAEVCKRDIEDRIVAFQKDQRQIEDLQLGTMKAFRSVGGDLE